MAEKDYYKDFVAHRDKGGDERSSLQYIVTKAVADWAVEQHRGERRQGPRGATPDPVAEMTRRFEEYVAGNPGAASTARTELRAVVERLAGNLNSSRSDILQMYRLTERHLATVEGCHEELKQLRALFAEAVENIADAGTRRSLSGRAAAIKPARVTGTRVERRTGGAGQ